VADRELRELERLAKSGDLEAKKRLREARRRHGIKSPMARLLEQAKASLPKDLPKNWTCSGPIRGECGIRHKSEETALRCCRRDERQNDGWRHPHTIDCSSLIHGTDYICSCGAFERSRLRAEMRLLEQELRENPRTSKHKEIERKFKEWALRRIESERYISGRYASFLVAEYRKQTGISSKKAVERLREWGIDDLIIQPPFYFIGAPEEIREEMHRLWDRRDGNLGWH